jgi:hypothetical protein
VEIEVEGCEDKICEGRGTFTIFQKNHLSPFQVLKLPDTSFMLGENDQPSANITRLDQQSAVIFSDYNLTGLRTSRCATDGTAVTGRLRIRSICFCRAPADSS